MNTLIDSSNLTERRVALPTWGLIKASGGEARAFLHAQFSNDLLNLDRSSAQWTAYCSAKGRMLAGFLACGDDEGGYFLLCDRALVPMLTKRLRMFVLRAKVTLEDAGDSLAVVGRIGGAAGARALEVIRDSAGTTINLPAVDGVARALTIGLRSGASPGASSGAAATADTADAADCAQWARLMIRAGEVWITPATQDQFVPQMVNFDAIGGINFKKGCYPGQEVVARAHYRGAVKRRMYRASVAAGASAGQALFSTGANAQECGLVANATAVDAGNSEILAVVPIETRVNSPVRLGSVEGPALVFETLPYTIPEAA